MLEIILFEGFCPLKIKIPSQFSDLLVLLNLRAILQSIYNFLFANNKILQNPLNSVCTIHQHMYNFLFASTVEPCFTDTHLIQTPHCFGHPLNTNTSLLRTVFLVPSPYSFPEFAPLNMDTFNGSLSVRVNGVSL